MFGNTLNFPTWSESTLFVKKRRKEYMLRKDL